MINITKSGNNSKAISVKDIALPTVENVMQCKVSEKGNRTFHYKREAFEVFVPDGSYEIAVQVTAYVKAGTIHSIKQPIVKQPTNAKKDAVQALIACGFTPEDAARLVKGK